MSNPYQLFPPPLQCVYCQLPNCNSKRHSSSLQHIYPTCISCGIELNELIELYNSPAYRSPVFCEICNKEYNPSDAVNDHFETHFRKGSIWSTQCFACEQKVPVEPTADSADQSSKYSPIDSLPEIAENTNVTTAVDITRPLNPNGLYECQHCPTNKRKTFKLLLNFLRHEQEVHQISKTDEQPIACPKCPRRFNEHHQLQLHSRIHKNSASDKHQKITCTLCEQSFTNYFDRTQHEKQSHYNSETGRWMCHKCSHDFASKMGTIIHLRLHEGSRPYVCDQCGASFTRKYFLERHMVSHSAERPFKCDICSSNRRFACMEALKLHIRAQHTKRNQYPCNKCDRVFSYYTDRKRHIRSHGGIEKKIVCLMCGKRFYEPKELRLHNKKHHFINL